MSKACKDWLVLTGIALFLFAWVFFGIELVLIALIGDPQFSKVENGQYFMTVHPNYGYKQVSVLTYDAMNTYDLIAKIIHPLGMLGGISAMLIRAYSSEKERRAKARSKAEILNLDLSDLPIHSELQIPDHVAKHPFPARGMALFDIDESDELTPLIPRTPLQVAQRVLAIIAIVDKAQQKEGVEAWVATHKITSFFTHNEAQFYKQKSPQHKDRVHFSWQIEAVAMLLWALRLIDAMPALNTTATDNVYREIDKITENPQTFLSSANLRPFGELNEVEKYLHDQHGRSHDAWLFKKTMPKVLDPRIVYWRRYAASWLVGWGDDWDEVPTDT